MVRSNLFAKELPADPRVVYDTALYVRLQDPNKPYSKYVQYCCDKEDWLLEYILCYSNFCTLYLNIELSSSRKNG